jgi:hypothetical protein
MEPEDSLPRSLEFAPPVPILSQINQSDSVYLKSF